MAGSPESPEMADDFMVVLNPYSAANWKGTKSKVKKSLRKIVASSAALAWWEGTHATSSRGEDKRRGSALSFVLASAFQCLFLRPITT